MERLKKLHIIFSVLGVLIGVASFFIRNAYLAFLAATLVYAVSFFVIKAFKLIKESREFFAETFLTFFGFWILAWILLFNIFNIF